ncbi:MAG TPA: flagellin [Tepidisphaeraceae bacterium]|nr:flagellin [Tepidisphaeraceae bacterium]
MSVINTNVSSLIAQRALNQNQKALNTSLERLSTGLKINSGADDPAGLIASQNLQAEQAGINAAIGNAQKANNILGTAEGGLNEVSSLLTQLQGLVSQSANTGGLSSDEIAANQLQVDSILSTINRIAQSTSFEGTKLLDGNFDYTTSSVGTSAIGGLQVNSASVPDGGKVNVVVQVVNSAQTAELQYSGGTVTGSTVTLEIAGNLGTTQLSFASGTTVSSIVTAVNAVTNTTGVSASVTGAGSFKVDSTQYGSAQYVGLKAISGTFALASNKATGRDATVTINGSAAETAGLHVNYDSASLNLDFDVSTSANFNSASKTFAITGGGATFALGAKVDEGDKASIGIASVSTGSLGSSALGFLNSLGSGGANSLNSGNLVAAQNILTQAVQQVSNLRGRIGAFQDYTIGSTVNSLSVAYENVSSAESDITDTDFAQETSNLTRDQILTQAAQTVLSQANSRPSAVLNLLQNA